MSKFRDASAFDTFDGYELLPFRFTQLNGENYLLTNMAGEGLVASRIEIDELVNHRLNRHSTLYPDLLSKHFIRTGSSITPLELTALKLRTKNSELANFTSLHLFVVTLRCEHSCPYCQVSRQSDDKVAFDMSEETADRSLDLVFKSPSPSIKIEFQGGEPLLNFSLIKYIVRTALERNQVHKRDLSFVIATNLAVLDDEILEFCRKFDVYISTSLDGPADLHNANRPRPGRDSYERTISGIQKAREALGIDRVSALMTTTQRSLGRVRDIIDQYIALDFPGIFLRPLSPYGFAVKTKAIRAYNVDDWLNFYFEGLDYIIALNQSGVRFREFYAMTVLRKMLTPFPTGYVDLMSPSGAGIAALVYNYDGDVYASDESRMLAEMGDHKFRLGNVNRESFVDIFTSDVLLDALDTSFAGSAPMCTECAFEPFCGSDPVYHYATQGDVVGHKVDSGFCSRNMSIMKRLIEYLGDDTIRPIIEGWVR